MKNVDGTFRIVIAVAWIVGAVLGGSLLIASEHEWFGGLLAGVIGVFAASQMSHVVSA